MYFVHLSDKKWKEYKDDKITIFCFGYLLNSNFKSLFESILKVIQNRTFQIKNAIEFMRFQSGLG